MRPAAQIQFSSDPDFTRLTLGRREVVLHRDIGALATPILDQLDRIITGGPYRAGSAGAGNRASAFRLRVTGAPEMFARRSRRGGWLRFLVSDLYFGQRPRPFEELAISIEAVKRKIPVAAPMGAIVEWAGPVFYRGWFLSRAVPGMTLWEFVRTDDDPAVRRHVLVQVSAAIDTMHARGLCHGDLNLHNLIVTKAGEGFAVIILDLDKARLYGGPVPEAARRANFARLLRSARKLDPAGRYLDAAALNILKPN
jgi:lipopolysaccharide kinase (Kdo/WaaP) family protein